jgi:hypothetical protein
MDGRRSRAEETGAGQVGVADETAPRSPCFHTKKILADYTPEPTCSGGRTPFRFFWVVVTAEMSRSIHRKLRFLCKKCS